MTALDECLDTFLDRCSAHQRINATTIAETVTESLQAKHPTGRLLELENRWYHSLPKPDYSVYADPYYIAEAWCCWRVYSRKYLKNIRKRKSFSSQRSVLSALGDVNVLLDLGCGYGHTAAVWKEYLPDAKVIGTNVPDTLQMKVATELGREHGFTMEAEPPIIKTDVVFASEYFEHIEEPLDHLKMLIDRLHPEVIITANAFGQRAIGHFDWYKVGQKTVRADHMNRVFTYAMNKLGYARIKTRMWNQRPALWARTA